jgi:hypothetical protein
MQGPADRHSTCWGWDPGENGAGLIVTARLEGRGRPLIGVARTITDVSWCAYLAELAVSRSVQRLGVALACWRKPAVCSGRG